MVEGLAPPTRAVVHSQETICRRLRMWKSFFIDYLGIIFICVMSTKLPMISLVEVELE